MRTFAHNDIDELRALLEAEDGHGLVVVESVYSMGGADADLQRIARVVKAHRAMLMVDESHALEVYGPRGAGLAEAEGVLDQVDLYMITLSKSLASIGGFIGARRELCSLLRHSSPSMVFQAAIPPASAASALKALDLLEAGEGRSRVIENTTYFRKRLPRWVHTEGTSPIVPVFGRTAQGIRRAAAHLMLEGVYTPAVTYPAVDRSRSRLRFTITAAHSRVEMDAAIEALGSVRNHLEEDNEDGSAHVSRIPIGQECSDETERSQTIRGSNEQAAVVTAEGHALTVTGPADMLSAALRDGPSLLRAIGRGTVGVEGSLEALAAACGSLDRRAS